MAHQNGPLNRPPNGLPNGALNRTPNGQPNGPFDGLFDSNISTIQAKAGV